MSSKPLRFLALRKATISEEKFIKKLHHSRDVKKTKSLILNATPFQIRVIDSIVKAHNCPKQRRKICQRSYRKIEKAKKLKYIRKHFSPDLKLESIDKTKKSLVKIIPLLRIFTSSVLG